MSLPVLYRDEALLALAKPAGMLVHRSPVATGAQGFALQAARAAAGRRVYPVHRLDRPTAGVLLFALDPGIAATMMQRFAAGEVGKRYIAVVRGWTALEGRIDHSLSPPRDAHAGSSPAAGARKRAVTDYRRLATAQLPHPVGRYATARYSLLCLVPATGRRHQLRRHLKHLSHPILGDTTYGDGRHNRFFREHLGCRRLLLAARTLSFAHPVTGLPLRLQAPLDAELRAVLAALGWGQVPL